MKVIYIGRFGYPTSAAGIRVAKIAEQLTDNGIHVDMICNTIKPNVAFDCNNALLNYQFVYEQGSVSALKQVLETVFASKAFHFIITEIAKEKPSAVVLYNDAYFLTKRLIPYCKKRGIRIVADVTEWYEMPRRISLNNWIIPFLTDKRITHLDRRLDAVISISPYLEEYYRSIGVETAFVPPIIDVTDMCCPKSHYKPVRLIYAGNPGEKDILWPMINAVSQANEQDMKLQLDVYGIPEKALQSAEEQRGVTIHGIVDHKVILDALQEADFSFLLRSRQRYAKAGFSTKFVECMSCGVAMICNSVGGAETTLTNGLDGFLIDDCSQESLLYILNKIALLDNEQISSMRLRAHQTAIRLFTSEIYKETILKIILGDDLSTYIK